MRGRYSPETTDLSQKVLVPIFLSLSEIDFLRRKRKTACAVYRVTLSLDSHDNMTSIVEKEDSTLMMPSPQTKDSIQQLRSASCRVRESTAKKLAKAK